MRFSNVAIETLVSVLPEEVWTSEAIEERLAPVYERLKLPQGRLELMTGIRERRMWPEGTRPSQASAQAACAALARSCLSRESMDMLIHAAVSRDRLEPATAAYVHLAALLPPTARFLDVSNACLGFMDALTLAAALIESGQARRILVCSGENGRPLVEHTLQRLLGDTSLTRQSIKPFFANFTIGCGAVAAIVCDRALAPGKPRLLGGHALSDTASSRLCEGDTSGSDALDMRTDSEELLEAGILLARKTWQGFKAATGWDEQTPQAIIGHQVGKQHQRRLYEALALDPAKDCSTFPFMGNVGSVSLPATLAYAMETGFVKENQRVALLGIGSGLSCLMLALHT